MQYLFMLSNGSYSDYCVGGLYSSDHEISEMEWRQHYKIYQDKSSKLRRNLREESITHDYFIKWQKDNDPEETFIKLHNLVAVEYTELWRG